MEGEKPTSGNIEAGSESSAASLIEQANRAREELEKTRTALNSDMKKFEEMQARAIISGKSLAGAQPQMSEQEQFKRKALEFWKGTDIERAINKYG